MRYRVVVAKRAGEEEEEHDAAAVDVVVGSIHSRWKKWMRRCQYHQRPTRFHVRVAVVLDASDQYAALLESALPNSNKRGVEIVDDDDCSGSCSDHSGSCCNCFF